MIRVLFAVLLVGMIGAAPVAGQPEAMPAPEVRSSKKAFALSLLAPGLGHRYAQGGSWRGGATLFALADGALWTSLVAGEWRRSNREQSFKTLAATRANALVDGKNRTFFLNLATYRSSNAFLDIQLRNRAWDQVNYVSERAFQWAWQTEDDFRRFRSLREDAESLRRRRSFLIATLVGNRLLAGLLAVRATNRANRSALAELRLSFSPPPPNADLPMLNVRIGF